MSVTLEQGEIVELVVSDTLEFYIPFIIGQTDYGLTYSHCRGSTVLIELTIELEDDSTHSELYSTSALPSDWNTVHYTSRIRSIHGLLQRAEIDIPLNPTITNTSLSLMMDFAPNQPPSFFPSDAIHAVIGDMLTDSESCDVSLILSKPLEFGQFDIYYTYDPLTIMSHPCGCINFGHLVGSLPAPISNGSAVDTTTIQIFNAYSTPLLTNGINLAVVFTSAASSIAEVGLFSRSLTSSTCENHLGLPPSLIAPESIPIPLCEDCNSTIDFIIWLMIGASIIWLAIGYIYQIYKRKLEWIYDHVSESFSLNNENDDFPRHSNPPLQCEECCLSNPQFKRCNQKVSEICQDSRQTVGRWINGTTRTNRRQKRGNRSRGTSGTRQSHSDEISLQEMSIRRFGELDEESSSDDELVSLESYY